MRDLPQGWKQSELGTLADVAIGGTPSRDIPRYWANNDMDGKPWVAISDLHGRVIDFTSESITEAGIANSNVKLVKRGTVLMSFKLSLGRVAFAGRDLYTNEAIAAFLVNDQVTPAYLYYALPDAVRGAATDVAIKGATLNKKSLRKLVIPHPSPQAQKKIASILSTIDTAIEQTEALIEKYQHIKAGLMHDLFTRGVLPNGQLRPPREQAPELYQETAIGWIPREWTVAKLDDVIRIIDCKHVTPKYLTDGYPVIRPRNVKLEGLDFSDVEFVSKHDYMTLTDVHTPKEGDIIFSRNASFGIPAFVESSVPPFAIGQDVVVMTRKQANTRFVYFALTSAQVFQQILIKSGGSTFARINLSDIRGLKIPLPIESEQSIVTERLLLMDVQIAGLKESLTKITKQKLGLMQDLLTGKVPVTVDALVPQASA